MEKITQQFIDLCLEEFKKEKNKKLLQVEVIDPLIIHVLEKIQPMIIATSVYFITTATLIIILVILIAVKK